MKRDLDLLRDIMLRIEDIGTRSHYTNIQDFLDLNSDNETISYHLFLLVDDGLVECAGSADYDGIVDYDITVLTMRGCEYLESIRDAGIWHDTKEKLKNFGGVATAEIIKSIAVSIMKSKLGI